MMYTKISIRQPKGTKLRLLLRPVIALIILLSLTFPAAMPAEAAIVPGNFTTGYSAGGTKYIDLNKPSGTIAGGRHQPLAGVEDRNFRSDFKIN